MRQYILYAAILIGAVQTQGQTASKAQPEPAAEAATPALTKTVTADPNDSPMVRAAKKAVASRVHPTQRRVVTLTSTNTRGRVAFASGPTTGPKPLPPNSDAAAQERQRASLREVAAIKAAAEKERQEKLKQLEAEENRVGAEMDEPYGNDLEEDQVDRRMSEIQEERKQLQEPPPPPQ